MSLVLLLFGCPALAQTKTLKLATREEVRDLKDTIRTLERALKEVQAEVGKGNGAKATKPAS